MDLVVGAKKKVIVAMEHTSGGSLKYLINVDYL